MNKCSIMGWYCPWSTQKDHTWILTSQHSLCDKTNAIQPQIKKNGSMIQHSPYDISDRDTAIAINYKKKWPRATTRVTLVVKPEARMQLTRSENYSTPLMRHIFALPCEALTMRQFKKESTVLLRNNMGAQPSFQKRLLVDFLIRRYLLEGLS